jgi:hypothetical protein
MNIGARARQHWDTVHLARYGALLGFLGAIIEQFCHAFCPTSWWHQILEGDLFTHVLIETAVFAGAGASLLAAISAIHNWIMGDH